MIYHDSLNGQEKQKVLHVGVDKLEIAFQGAFSLENLAFLESARNIAEKNQQKHTFEFFGDVIKIHQCGRQGGYAFVIDTGITGEQISIKNNSDSSQWNIFVSFSAAGLLEKGEDKMITDLIEKFTRWGVRILQESVSRVDVAVDIANSDFKLNTEAFTKHSNMQTCTHSEQYKSRSIGRRNTYVCHGSHASKTIQAVMYDKTLLVRDKKDFFWFDYWGVPEEKDNKSFVVWRIEVRAFQRYLKEKINIKTFSQLKEKLPTLVQDILQKIRLDHYEDLTKRQDTRRTHPIWQLAIEATKNKLGKIIPEQLKGKIIACMRQQKIEECEKQLIAHVRNLIALRGIKKVTNRRVQRELFRICASETIEGWRDDIQEKMEEINKKYIFLSKSKLAEYKEQQVAECKPIYIDGLRDLENVVVY